MAVLDTLETLLPALDEIISTYAEPRIAKFKHRGKLYEVYVREIKIKEMQAQIADTKDPQNLYGLARGACRLIAKKDGTRLMDPENSEHIARMEEMGIRWLTALNKAAELDDEAEATGN